MNKIDKLGERMSEAAEHCLFTLINWMEQVYDLLEPITIPLWRILCLVAVVLVSWVVVLAAAYGLSLGLWHLFNTLVAA